MARPISGRVLFGILLLTAAQLGHAQAPAPASTPQAPPSPSPTVPPSPSPPPPPSPSVAAVKRAEQAARAAANNPNENTNARILGVGFNLMSLSVDESEGTFSLQGILRLIDQSGNYRAEQIATVRNERAPTGPELLEQGVRLGDIVPFFKAAMLPGSYDTQGPDDDHGAVFCPSNPFTPTYYSNAAGDDINVRFLNPTSSGSTAADSASRTTFLDLTYSGNTLLDEEKFPFAYNTYLFELYFASHRHIETAICIVPELTGISSDILHSGDNKAALRQTSRIQVQVKRRCLVRCYPSDSNEFERLENATGRTFTSNIFINGNNDGSYCREYESLEDIRHCDPERVFESVAIFLTAPMEQPINSFMNYMFSVTVTTFTFLLGELFVDPCSKGARVLALVSVVSTAVLQYISMVNSNPYPNVFTIAHIYYLVCMVFTCWQFLWVMIISSVVSAAASALPENGEQVQVFTRHMRVLWRVSIWGMLVSLAVSLTVTALCGNYHQYSGWLALGCSFLVWVVMLILVSMNTSKIQYWWYRAAKATNTSHFRTYWARVYDREMEQRKAHGRSLEELKEMDKRAREATMGGKLEKRASGSDPSSEKMEEGAHEDAEGCEKAALKSVTIAKKRAE